MRSKVPTPWSFAIISVAGIAFAAMIIFFLAPTENRTQVDAAQNITAAKQADAASTATALPIRLTIPKIKVDAPLEYVGLTVQGAMAVPAGPTDAAWFDLGPRPGDAGSAVIAGHDGWKDNIAAVFDDLHELQPGDKVYVEDSTGATTTFVVRKVQTYDQNADAATVFNSSDGKAHLNLITCEGTWNAAEKSYSDRLVVFTDEED